MSTLTLTLNNQGGSPSNLGYIRVYVNFGGDDISLRLNLSLFTNKAYWFKWFSVPVQDINASTLSYAAAFNRDFKNVGGTNNMSATVTGNNTVLITAKVGQFVSVEENSDYVTLSSVINNVTPTPDLVFIRNISQTVGDCENIEYSATASGGVPPYVLKKDTTTLNSNWDGSLTTFNLKRGVLFSLSVTDSEGTKKTLSANPPRTIKSGELTLIEKQFDGYSDVVVSTTVFIEGTRPLEYSLDDTSQTTGQDYQDSNAFAGVLPGLYKIFVKDRYGCEVFNTVEVRAFQDSTVTEKIRFFNIHEGQTIIFSPFIQFDIDTKKNYFNTGSYNQDVQAVYPLTHYFDSKDSYKGTQFKSSYDFHIITLHKFDGSKKDIAPILIQENLGVTEKMDCNFFSLGNKTGVYFQGGNTYFPDTDTVIGANDFNGTTPIWAKEGQAVFFDEIGAFFIESTGFSSDYGGYFVVDIITPSSLTDKVQLTYNKKDYNLFEFYINPMDLDEKSFLVIEKGFDDSGMVEGNPWVSEKLKRSDYTGNRLKLEWSDLLNKGGIVFQSGITYMARLEGEINPIWKDEAETQEGDDRDYSIDQSSRMGFEILIEPINAKQVTQLSIASGLDGFKCNNLSLIRNKPPEVKRLGKSNMYTWKCEFSYGENNLAIQPNEIVLSVSTGVVGGGSDGINPAPDLSGVTLIKDQQGNIITNEGKIIKS